MSQPSLPSHENLELEPLSDRLWRQVQEGLDADRLLPSLEKRKRDLAKKLDRPLEKNGWRIYVSGAAHTIATGKAPQHKNTEVALVESVARWRRDVLQLLPDRIADFETIVQAGLDQPEALPPRN